ncbi:MAG TPA: response regulator [Elusimicrobiota bacterium]|nr:response regulator [Elusimicrobiota bacterium]
MPEFSPTARQNPSILVVEDLESTREFVSFILRKQGYHVLLAKDGKTGLSLSVDKQPDLLLVDILLPGMDGYSLCSRIKQDPALKRQKIILFSALNAQANKLKAEESGADAFLEKPVEPARLLSVIKSLLSPS